ncbi:MAG TPA: DUF1622 domain-containing protein [Candidatus Babeliales bacterium]|nr:DUF1622 domain-containing protein [Candidatus Babeliales bacterium]
MGFLATYGLTELLSITKELLELAGISIILISAVISLTRYFQDLFSRQVSSAMRANRIRIRLGQGIVSGLEVIVAADVISTTIDQNYQTLGLLILTVIIRVALSYFLAKDLNSIDPKELKKIED